MDQIFLKEVCQIFFTTYQISLFLYFGLLFHIYLRVLIKPVNLFLGILFCVFNSKMALTLHMMKTVVATWPQMRTNIKKTGNGT